MAKPENIAWNRFSITPQRADGGRVPILGVGTPPATRTNHQPSVTPDEMKSMITKLRKIGSMQCYALQLIVLTCVRSAEGRGARWSEISGDVWSFLRRE